MDFTERYAQFVMMDVLNVLEEVIIVLTAVQEWMVSKWQDGN
jgi:hypothetical protein